MIFKRFSTIGMILVMVAVCSFSISSNVYAASDVYGKTYYTTMTIPDNYLFTSKERFFYTGTQTLDMSLDSWNSSICSSSSDSSHLGIWLYYNSQKRLVAAKAIDTKIYTCHLIDWGSMREGYYYYYFQTYATDASFCGFTSNSMIMKSA